MSNPKEIIIALLLLTSIHITVTIETSNNPDNDVTQAPFGDTQSIEPNGHPEYGHGENTIHDNSSHHGNDSHHSNDSEHSGSHGHGVQLASLHIEYVKQPLIITVFLLIVAVCKLGFHHANFLSSKVPESCLLIILGTVVGAIMHFTGSDRQYFDYFSSDLFFLYLLPPIVLESAYSLHDRVFFENLGTILLFAVAGTLLNCFILAPVLYGLSLCGAMGSISVPLVQCFVFCSLIVAVDPVAVLAIFEEIGVNNVLYFLVFGESLLNDAVTIVLYNTMKAFTQMETIPPSQIALGFGSFFTVSLGGLSIGIFIGALCSFLTRFTLHVRVVEPLAVFSLAYAAYLLAELFHFSGIISIIACGLMQAQYAFHNISHKSETTIKYFSKVLSTTCDSIIFMFLGLALVSDKHVWHTGFILWSVVLCLIIRFGVVYFLTYLANRLERLRQVDWEEQFIMAYGGLRGAVAFSLVAMLDSKDVPHQCLFETTTLAVIIFTVFLQGITIKPLVKLLRISSATKGPVSIYEEINNHVTDHVMAGIEEICGHYGHNQMREQIDYVDDHYIRPLLMRNPASKDGQIMQIYWRMAIQMHLENIEGCNINIFSSDLELYKPQLMSRHPSLDDNNLPMHPDLSHKTHDVIGFPQGFRSSVFSRGCSVASPGIMTGSPWSTPGSQRPQSESVSPASGSSPVRGIQDKNPMRRRATVHDKRQTTLSDDVFEEDGQSTDKKKLGRQKSMFNKIFRTRSQDRGDEIIDAPTVDDIRRWMVKDPSRNQFHKRHDRNLINDERGDLVYHLHEKQRRNQRRRVSMGYKSGTMSPSESTRVTPAGSQEELSKRPIPKLGIITEVIPLTRSESDTDTLSARQGSHRKGVGRYQKHQPGTTPTRHSLPPNISDSDPAKDPSTEGDTTPLLHHTHSGATNKPTPPGPSSQSLTDETKPDGAGDDSEKLNLLDNNNPEVIVETVGDSGMSLKGRGHLERQNAGKEQDTHV